MKKNWLMAMAVFMVATVYAGKKVEVIAYYTGDATTIKQYNVAHLTHIIYSFLRLKGDSLYVANDKQKQTLKALVDLKTQYPQLKIMVALGGWGGCEPCSGVFSTEIGRKHFVASVKSILDEYQLDGLDLDWEYPVIEGYPGHPYAPSDKQNFTELVKALRKSLGKKKEISFAAGGFSKFIEESIDWKEAMKYVNRVNLMSYDLVSGFSKQTGHHTTLYSNSIRQQSTDRGVQLLLQQGVSPKKIVIGAAFYARTWKDVPDVNNGLYQPGEFQSFIPYKKGLNSLDTAHGFETFYDEQAKSYWKYNKVKKEFATFDNGASVRAKVKYLKKMKLKGIMFWELTLDTPQYGLLQAITDEISLHSF